jgi:hypothetical protein
MSSTAPSPSGFSISGAIFHSRRLIDFSVEPFSTDIAHPHISEIRLHERRLGP